jgi:hypothetical protein
MRGARGSGEKTAEDNVWKMRVAWLTVCVFCEAPEKNRGDDAWGMQFA